MYVMQPHTDSRLQFLVASTANAETIAIIPNSIALLSRPCAENKEQLFFYMASEISLAGERTAVRY